MTKLIDSEYWHDDGKEYTLASRIGVLIEIGALTKAVLIKKNKFECVLVREGALLRTRALIYIKYMIEYVIITKISYEN